MSRLTGQLFRIYSRLDRIPQNIWALLGELKDQMPVLSATILCFRLIWNGLTVLLSLLSSILSVNKKETMDCCNSKLLCVIICIRQIPFLSTAEYLKQVCLFVYGSVSHYLAVARLWVVVYVILWLWRRVFFTQQEKCVTCTGKSTTRSTSVHRTQWSLHFHESQMIRKIVTSDTNSTTYCKTVHLPTVDQWQCTYTTVTVKHSFHVHQILRVG